MFRAHDLISNLKTDSDDYKHCMSAIKFDLGEIGNVLDMETSSSGEFFNIPFPVCLFQVEHGMDIHFFLAREDCGGVVWRRYGKQLNDGFKWYQEDIELFIDSSKNLHAEVKRISTGEVLGGANANLTGSEEWTLLRYIELARTMEVFSCSNVRTIENVPPRFINSRRTKKGKVPFLSYRTLHIILSNNKTIYEFNCKSDRASPRLHLRRGHIRKYDNGSKTWVSSCLVGDKSKGFSSHDYKVKL